MVKGIKGKGKKRKNEEKKDYHFIIIYPVLEL